MSEPRAADHHPRSEDLTPADPSGGSTVTDHPALFDEQAYRLIFDNAGVGIFKSTPDGRYLMVNPALAELLGFDSVDAMLKVDIRELYADPKRRNQFKRLVARHGQVRDFVIEARRIDGEPIWVSETATLVRDPAGQPAYYIGTIIDITRRVEALQALVAAERDYREIFEHATIGIYRSSLDGRQLRANPALVRLNGYQTEEELLAAINDIAKEWYVDPERRDQFVDHLARDGRVEGFVSEVYRHRTRERIWITESARLVRDENDQPLYYEGTVQDITGQMRAREALLETRTEAEAASRAKSAFLANMSHELRTPLNAIIGFAEVMEQEVFGPLGSSRYQDYLSDIRSSGLHLLQLLDDILDLSKVEAGKLELDEGRCDLPVIFDEAVRMLRPLAQERGIAVTVEVQVDPLPQIRGDVRRLRQVALNLISNGVKYNRRGGSVKVTLTREPAGGVRVVVADSGIGIAPENQERVFEPFTQLNRAQSERQEGTGLGLPLCRQLVELHGGYLTLESRTGEGTAVIIDLPAARCRPLTPG
ncbi:MAG: PAS domain-containing sensor histidine kinase [Kiloniellales bacterium]